MNRSMHKQHISMPFWLPRMHLAYMPSQTFQDTLCCEKYLLFCTLCHPLRFMGPCFPNAFTRAGPVWLDAKITAGPLIASFFLTDFPELPNILRLCSLFLGMEHMFCQHCAAVALCSSVLLCAGSISLLCGASQECILEGLCIFYIQKQKLLLSALIALVYYDSAL